MSGRKKNTPKLSPVPDIADIYAEHSDQLRGFIAKRVAFREDCEDILQNVFYQLARVDLVNNPIEQMSAWLYSVARNQIIDRSRKKKELRMASLARTQEEDGEDADLSFLMPDRGPLPDSEYLNELIWAEMESSLKELPTEQRTVFELTELQGFSFKEISESTGVPVNTLISRKRYAVLHLRERMQSLYDELLEP